VVDFLDNGAGGWLGKDYRHEVIAAVKENFADSLESTVRALVSSAPQVASEVTQHAEDCAFKETERLASRCICNFPSAPQASAENECPHCHGELPLGACQVDRRVREVAVSEATPLLATCADCYEMGIIRTSDSPRLVHLCDFHATADSQSKTIADLEAEVRDANRGIKAWSGLADEWRDNCERPEKRVADQQARIERLEKALRDVGSTKQRDDKQPCYCDTIAKLYCVGQPQCVAARTALENKQ